MLLSEPEQTLETLHDSVSVVEVAVQVERVEIAVDRRTSLELGHLRQARARRRAPPRVGESALNARTASQCSWASRAFRRCSATRASA